MGRVVTFSPEQQLVHIAANGSSEPYPDVEFSLCGRLLQTYFPIA